MSNKNFFSTKKGLLILCFAIILGVVIGLGMKIIVAKAALTKITIDSTSGVEINMGGKKITNVGGVGTSDSDVATIDYVKESLGVSGTAKYLPKFNATDGVGLQNSIIFDDGTNIGIGTASPGAKLDVVGEIQSDSLDIDGVVRIDKSYAGTLVNLNNTYTDNVTNTTLNIDSGDLSISDVTGKYLYGVKIDTGNIEIQAVDAPASANLYGLYISGGSVSEASPTYTATANGYGLYVSAPSGTPVNGGVYAAYFDGNVGIGTTSPGVALDVSGDIEASSNITAGGANGFTTGSSYLRSGSANVAGTLTATTFNATTDMNAPYFDVTAGNDYGIRFWGGSTSYTFTMGNDQADDGTVTDYSMHSNMGTSAGRGFTFGSSDTAVSASINALTGDFHTDGEIQSDGTGDNWFGGNVGIGVTSPGDKLHVEGSISATRRFAFGGNSDIVYSDPRTLTNKGILHDDDWGTDYRYAKGYCQIVRGCDGYSAASKIDDSLSSCRCDETYGCSSESCANAVGGAGGWWRINSVTCTGCKEGYLNFFNKDNKLILYSKGDLIINTGGDVGIGTTSPQAKLHVEGDAIINKGGISIDSFVKINDAIHNSIPADLWLGEYNGHFYSCNSAGHCRYQGDGGGNIYAMAVFNGKLWLGQSTGYLLSCDDRGLCDSHGAQGVTTIVKMAVFDGKLWLGQADGYLSSCDSSATSCTSHGQKGIAGLTAMSVFNGKLWLGSDLGYLYSCDSSGTCTDHGDKGEGIFAMAVFNGKLWLGQGTGYLLSCDSSAVCTNHGDKGDVIWEMAVFSGKLWLGHDLGYFSSCTSSAVCTNHGDKGDVITAMTVFNGKLWIGQFDGVLQSCWGSGTCVSQGDKGDGINEMILYKPCIKAQEWQTPTFLNGWVNYNTTYNSAGYFRDKNGIVHLRGLVKSGTIDSIIFQLPVGYRPEKQELHVTISSNQVARCDIDISGNVKEVLGGNVWISLDGITFRASGY